MLLSPKSNEESNKAPSIMRKTLLAVASIFLFACSSSDDNPTSILERIDSVEQPEETGPSCSDGVQNGDETGVDCGGTCDACPEDPSPMEENDFGTLTKVVDLVSLGYENSFSLTDFAVDENSNFWMANGNRGTLHYDGSNWIRKDDLDGLIFGNTPDISIDNDNVAWVTFGEVIYKYDITSTDWNFIYSFITSNRFGCRQTYHSKRGNSWFIYDNRAWEISNPPTPINVGIYRHPLSDTGKFVVDYVSESTLLLESFQYSNEGDSFGTWEAITYPSVIANTGNFLSFVADNKIWKITSNVDIRENPNFLYYADLSNVSNWEKKEGKDFVEFPNGTFSLSQNMFHDSQDRIWIEGTIGPIGPGLKYVLWNFDTENIRFDAYSFPEGFFPGLFRQGKDGKTYIAAGSDGNGGYNEIWEWTPPMMN